MPFKIAMVGDVGSGKTSLMKRKINNFFSDNSKATLGMEFARLTDPDEELDVQLWDIAGQEISGSMLRVYLKEVNLIILAADLTKSNTLENVKKWLDELERLNILPLDSLPILVATKSDIKSSSVEIKNLVAFAEEQQLIFDATTHVTSAKTGDQVAVFFEKVLDIAKEMANQIPVEVFVAPQASFFKPATFAIEDQAERRSLIAKKETTDCCNIPCSIL